MPEVREKFKTDNVTLPSKAMFTIYKVIRSAPCVAVISRTFTFLWSLTLFYDMQN